MALYNLKRIVFFNIFFKDFQENCDLLIIFTSLFNSINNQFYLVSKSIIFLIGKSVLIITTH